MVERVQVPFRPSRWEQGTATYDDGTTRATGRWADECQAPGCDQVAPSILPDGPGVGWLCLSVLAPRIVLVVQDEVHGERRSVVHDQVFWFCTPAHVAAWVSTLELVDVEEVEQDAAHEGDQR